MRDGVRVLLRLPVVGLPGIDLVRSVRLAGVPREGDRVDVGPTSDGHLGEAVRWRQIDDDLLDEIPDPGVLLELEAVDLRVQAADPASGLAAFERAGWVQRPGESTQP